MDSSTPLIAASADSPTSGTLSLQDALYHRAVGELGGALGRIAIGYEANPTHQQDLLQEIHIALWRSLGSFNGQCSLRTWVYRVAHNTASSHASKNRRRRLSKWISLEDLEELVEPIDELQSIDEHSVRERMLNLIRDLRAIDRDISLLYLEGVEAKEIAEIVGLSPGNVAQKIHRTKKILTKHFQSGNCP